MSSRLPLAVAYLLLSSTFVYATPEAFEVSTENFAELPGGKECDGIVGDFILRNELVTAVISHNSPRRRANMSTFYGAQGHTPGCLYDLGLRSEKNDQLTIFSPLGQRGDVSYVRIAEDSAKGEAAIETVTSSTKGNGLHRRHRYSIRDDMQGILITSTIANETRNPIPFKAKDSWTRFASKGSSSGIQWADAIDPADQVGYAFAPEPDNKATGEEITIAPGETFTHSRFVAIGKSPAEAVGKVLERHGEVGTITGNLTAPDGSPISTATVQIGKLKLYPDTKGRFSTFAKPGDHAISISDIGRETLEQTVTLKAGDDAILDQTLSAKTTLQFDVRLYDGTDTPCKVQFLRHDEDLSILPINLGPHNRAHGCANQYHSETGQFNVAVPPSKYTIIITRGIEFGAFNREIELEPGETKKLSATLIRQVQTP
ncbi:MAG: hypothetical protein ACI9UA_004487, partial [Pseudoalteromonas tetraodonis]